MVPVWRLGLRARLIAAALFYRGKRYRLDEIVRSIVDSDRLRRTELKSARSMNHRLDVLRHAARAVDGIDGVAAEFGVARGESLAVLAEAMPGRQVHGFDSFDGLPQDWGALLPKGHFRGPPPRLDRDNVRLHIGLFADTLAPFVADRPRVALVHVDCDLYESTTCVLEHVLPLLAPGGVIVFDEYYGYPSFEGHEYRAWHEAMARWRLAAEPLACSSHSASFRVAQPPTTAAAVSPGQRRSRGSSGADAADRGPSPPWSTHGREARQDRETAGTG